MLSRRLLRVKVIQCLYAALQKGETSLQTAEQELTVSIAKSYELYYNALFLLAELKKYHLNRVELLKKKHLATDEERNPNLRFSKNRIFDILDVALDVVKQQKKYGNLYENNPELIANLFKVVESSDVYNEYLALEDTDFELDKKFIVRLIDKVIAQNLSIYSFFEDNSVYWNDESEFIFSMAMKTIKGFSENQSNNTLIEEFKDQEDRDFVYQLFRKSFLSANTNRKLIANHTKNWEVERVSVLDTILMQAAITEVIEIAQVPVNVTLNEYIEISKYYSSEKSGVFINGVLDKIFEELETQKKIVKVGKGLIINKES